MSDTRKLIDFAHDQNGSEFRDALYSAIHDKVTAHIDAKRAEIAQKKRLSMMKMMSTNRLMSYLNLHWRLIQVKHIKTKELGWPKQVIFLGFIRLERIKI
jgi:hypothetical protein